MKIVAYSSNTRRRCDFTKDQDVIQTVPAHTRSLALPAPYRGHLRTTNAQERLHEELRRRERVIRIFPSRASILRLLGVLLMELEEQWTTGHRYLAMETYGQGKLATETAQKGGAPLVQIA